MYSILYIGTCITIMFALLCPFRLNSIMRRGAFKYNNNIILCIVEEAA